MLISLCSRCLWKFKRQSRRLLRALPANDGAARHFAKSAPLDLREFDISRVRNFSIIAHVDHGKSTLSDRLLEFTGAIERSSANKQVLDRLKIERQRGITVKAQTAALFFEAADGLTYLLNLIDTPGHVDFSHEVLRSVAASDGVVLLVDANDGVQAQTIANFYTAFARDLPVLPVLNKIDLPQARPVEVKRQLANLFGFGEGEVLEVSAKNGTGVHQLLQAIVDRLPPPSVDADAEAAADAANFKGLIVDSWYEQFKGAVCLVAAKAGRLRAGDEFFSRQLGGARHTAKEVGVFLPRQRQTQELRAGLVGYVVSSMRSTREALVGDTLLGRMGGEEVATFQAAQPMVFSGLYPVTQEDTDSLEASLNKLTLNDASVTVAPESNAALGRGWRLGFLGLLHMDVFRQRLEEEFDADVILTAPSIPYRLRLVGGDDGELVTITNPSLMPPEAKVAEYYEPVCNCTVIAPAAYLDGVTRLLIERRGSVSSQSYIDSNRLLVEAEVPLNEIVIDLVEVLKIRTSGFASFHYEESGWRSTQLVKLVPYVNERPIDELVTMIPSERARQRATQLAERLAEELPRQQFLIKIQLKVGSRVLASAQIKPFRKDVTQKIKSGTDRTRRQKLLAAQRDGKKRMRMVGSVEIPRDAFIKVLKS